MDEITEGFKQITGWDTPEEMAAFEKGKEVEEAMIIRYIKEWQGETRSVLGQILSKKFAEVSIQRKFEANKIKAALLPFFPGGNIVWAGGERFTFHQVSEALIKELQK